MGTSRNTGLVILYGVNSAQNAMMQSKSLSSIFSYLDFSEGERRLFAGDL